MAGSYDCFPQQYICWIQMYEWISECFSPKLFSGFLNNEVIPSDLKIREKEILSNRPQSKLKQCYWLWTKIVTCKQKSVQCNVSVLTASGLCSCATCTYATHEGRHLQRSEDGTFQQLCGIFEYRDSYHRLDENRCSGELLSSMRAGIISVLFALSRSQ